MHVWHEDRGFRAAEIRNRAILAARGSYCIFLDGDCIARPDFVATHRRLAEPGWFVTGNRILLSRALTAQSAAREADAGDLAAWPIGSRSDGAAASTGCRRCCGCRSGRLRRLRAQAWHGARSCNLAVWRADLDRVDGFDADYSGWGKEDSDIIVRLLHAGVRRKDGISPPASCICGMPEADRVHAGRQRAKLTDIIAGDRVRAQRGLSALQAAAPRDAAG